MATLSSRLAPLTVSVPAGSEPTSYTPIGPWTTNATYTGRWWRDKAHIVLQIDVAFTGATDAAAASFTFAQLLNGLGLTVNSSGFPSTGDVRIPIGGWSVLDSGAASYNGVASTTGNSIVDCWTSAGVQVSNTSPITFGANDNFALTVTLPISGWTSHTASATSANALVVGGQSVGSTLSFGATSNQGFNILANNTAAIASTAAGALTLGLPSAIGGSGYAGQAIVGRTDGNSPGSGYVGNSIISRPSGSGTLSSASAANAHSVTLPRGHWLVTGQLYVSYSGMTFSAGERYLVSSLSATSATLFDETVIGLDNQTTGTFGRACTPAPVVISSNGSTIVYLVGVTGTFSAGTAGVSAKSQITYTRIA